MFTESANCLNAQVSRVKVHQAYSKCSKRRSRRSGGSSVPALPLTFYFLPKLKSSAKMSHNHNIFPTWAFREKFGNEREDGEQSLSEEQGGEEKSLKQTRQGKKKAQPRFFFHVKKEGGSGFFFFTCRGIVLVSSLVFRLFSRLYSASQPPFPASPGTSACTRAARCRQRVRWANLIPLAEKLYVSTSVSRVRRSYF